MLRHARIMRNSLVLKDRFSARDNSLNIFYKIQRKEISINYDFNSSFFIIYLYNLFNVLINNKYNIQVDYITHFEMQ